jgi:hypothetical protein
MIVTGFDVLVVTGILIVICLLSALYAYIGDKRGTNQLFLSCNSDDNENAPWHPSDWIHKY